MTKIFSFITGWIEVRADGPFTERLINICMHRKLPIWDIKRCGKCRITFKTIPKEYKNFRIPAYRTRSKVRITKRCGLPFIIKKYNKRKLSIGGVVVLLLILWYTSTHIMGITVFGNKRISTEEILNGLKEHGVSLGQRTDKINPDSVRNNMISDMDRLAWIGINANGSRVYIEVVERIEKDKGIEKDDVSCNLIASKDGVIEDIIVREGQTLVGIGSGVRKGDVLVSGIVDSSVTGFRYVKARGEIYAQTIYSKTGCYPLEYTEEAPTGDKKTRYRLEVMEHELPLFFNKKAPYDNFSYEYNRKEYSLPIDILPSLFVIKEEYTCNRIENKKRTPIEALEVGKAELSMKIKNELDERCEVIKEDSSYTINEKGEIEVTVDVICRENIAEMAVIEKTLPE